MSVYKNKAQKSAEGKFNVDVPLTDGKGDGNGLEKGQDLSKKIYGSNDEPAVRGGHSDRDSTGR